MDFHNFPKYISIRTYVYTYLGGFLKSVYQQWCWMDISGHSSLLYFIGIGFYKCDNSLKDMISLEFLYLLPFSFLFCRYHCSFYFFIFYWSIVDLQCCVNFCCTAVIQLYMYIFFFILFSIMVYHRILNTVPCAIQ